MHVLLRPLTPRHSPCALSSLTTFSSFEDAYLSYSVFNVPALPVASAYTRTSSHFLKALAPIRPTRFSACRPDAVLASLCAPLPAPLPLCEQICNPQSRSRILTPSHLCSYLVWVGLQVLAMPSCLVRFHPVSSGLRSHAGDFLPALLRTLTLPSPQWA